MTTVYLPERSHIAQARRVMVFDDSPADTYEVSIFADDGDSIEALDSDYAILSEEFQELAEQWHHDTGHLSSPVQIAMHDAYQRIIGMGTDAIPLILSDMESRGGHWFWALRAITGQSPVPTRFRGNVQAAKKAWLDWGNKNGLY